MKFKKTALIVAVMFMIGGIISPGYVIGGKGLGDWVKTTFGKCYKNYEVSKDDCVAEYKKNVKEGKMTVDELYAENTRCMAKAKKGLLECRAQKPKFKPGMEDKASQMYSELEGVHQKAQECYGKVIMSCMQQHKVPKDRQMNKKERDSYESCLARLGVECEDDPIINSIMEKYISAEK